MSFSMWSFGKIFNGWIEWVVFVFGFVCECLKSENVFFPFENCLFSSGTACTGWPDWSACSSSIWNWRIILAAKVPAEHNFRTWNIQSSFFSFVEVGEEIKEQNRGTKWQLWDKIRNTSQIRETKHYLYKTLPLNQKNNIRSIFNHYLWPQIWGKW